MYFMGSNKKKFVKVKKSSFVCDFCGMLCSTENNDIIHKKCAVSFLESKGFVVFDTSLRRVLIGDENGFN